MIKFSFDAEIPDLSKELARLENPDQVQEDIRQCVALYRAIDAIVAASGTPKEAVAELDSFVAAMQAALDAMGGPAVALIAVPDDAAGATERVLTRLIAAANAARDDIHLLLPKRGGQPAPLHRDILIKRVVDVLQDAGDSTHFIRTARILEQCGVSAPKTGTGISDTYNRMQERIPGRRVFRL